MCWKSEGNLTPSMTNFSEDCRGTTQEEDERRVTHHSNADSHRSFTSAELKIKREADHQTSAEWVTAFGNSTQFHLYIAVSQSSFLQSPGTKACFCPILTSNKNNNNKKIPATNWTTFPAQAGKCSDKGQISFCDVGVNSSCGPLLFLQ